MSWIYKVFNAALHNFSFWLSESTVYGTIIKFYYLNITHNAIKYITINQSINKMVLSQEEN